jgi:CheY-like chemotaxis protein
MAEEKIDDILKEYEEGAKTALVCEENAETQQTVISVLKELKYHVEPAAGADDAFEKLRFNRYDVVVINEKYGGDPANNEVLKHLQYLPMSNRRHIFVALLGQAFNTNDNMKAYDMSVNVVINEKDLPNLRPILKKSIADNDQFYKVYKESLVKFGKA